MLDDPLRVGLGDWIPDLVEVEWTGDGEPLLFASGCFMLQNKNKLWELLVNRADVHTMINDLIKKNSNNDKCFESTGLECFDIAWHYR